MIRKARQKENASLENPKKEIVLKKRKGMRRSPTGLQDTFVHMTKDALIMEGWFIIVELVVELCEVGKCC